MASSLVTQVSADPAAQEAALAQAKKLAEERKREQEAKQRSQTSSSSSSSSSQTTATHTQAAEAKEESSSCWRMLCCCLPKRKKPIQKMQSSVDESASGTVTVTHADVPATPEAPPTRDWLLPPQTPEMKGRKCLVLDLDETLVHSSFRPVPGPDFIISIELDGVIHKVYVQVTLFSSCCSCYFCSLLAICVICMTSLIHAAPLQIVFPHITPNSSLAPSCYFNLSVCVCRNVLVWTSSWKLLPRSSKS